MKVEFHPLTIADLNEATQHYNGLQPGLGNQLRSEVYAVIEFIRENPELYTEVLGVRRALVKRFPYSVVYRVTNSQQIRVLLIRHHKRRPGHGSQRQ